MTLPTYHPQPKIAAYPIGTLLHSKAIHLPMRLILILLLFYSALRESTSAIFGRFRESKSIVLLILVTLVVPFAKAQTEPNNTLGSETTPATEGIRLSLDDAIIYALQNNFEARRAGLDLSAAQQQRWETIAGGLPQIDASAGYNYNFEQQVSVIPGEIAGGAPGTFVPVVFGTKQTATASATLRQLLFDGSYLVALKASNTFLQFSENAKLKTELQVTDATIDAYGNALLAESSIAILERNLNNLNETLRETRQIYDAGLGEQEDVEQLEITQLDLQNQLNRVRRLRGVAYDLLRVTLGMQGDTDLLLTSTLQQLATEYSGLGLQTQNLSLENNIDYQISTTNIDIQSLEVDLERSKALPSLSAFVNYGVNAFDDEFVFFDNNTRWFDFGIVGVQLNVPLFSSGARSARTKRARIELEQAELDRDNLVEQLDLQLETTRNDYEFALDNYATALKNLKLAERIENKNDIKFKEGLATSFELRQAQTQLYAAQQNVLDAMLLIINSYSDLNTLLTNVPTTKN